MTHPARDFALGNARQNEGFLKGNRGEGVSRGIVLCLTQTTPREKTSRADIVGYSLAPLKCQQLEKVTPPFDCHNNFHTNPKNRFGDKLDENTRLPLLVFVNRKADHFCRSKIKNSQRKSTTH